jgi:galactose mutarotase-like enzyme
MQVVCRPLRRLGESAPYGASGARRAGTALEHSGAQDHSRAQHELRSADLVVRVASRGAELVSVAPVEGPELLWQAGPAWPRHAPVLFPIVGRLPGDVLEVDGITYPMTQHGFARDREFTVLTAGPDQLRLRLEDDEQTRAHFPYAFRLDLHYAVDGPVLTVSYELTNPGTQDLPASLGAHPAFVWPLPGGAAKEAHTLTFAAPEPAPVRRLEAGLLSPVRHDSPVQGRVLRLSEQLFLDDALILDDVASRSVRYTAPGSPGLEVSWQGFAQLGLWSKPGADFLCIEPWHGFASPVGSPPAFPGKPGLMVLAPRETRRLSVAVRVLSAVDPVALVTPESPSGA